MDNISLTLRTPCNPNAHNRLRKLSVCILFTIRMEVAINSNNNTDIMNSGIDFLLTWGGGG